MRTKTLFTSTLLLFCLSFNNLNAQGKSLTINISEVKDSNGNIHIALFRPQDNFPFEGGAFKEFKTKALGGITQYTIKNLPLGDYAIAVYHDADQSGKCETNFIGYPKEGYCFSQNFKVFMSAPPFTKCGFTLSTDKSIDMMMRY